ncbi:hypothetical protein [Vagococcus salmoninarum]|uniref:hypothetical protein n=1 Tax=Vagococcus salmoninarum TaxID=2739 RepID=UPI00187E160C|nr:hypothetical protein [Vagococcus salmoninarum]MBE9390008.1 hypothetical protein [Vagococcus salmoninarum]
MADGESAEFWYAYHAYHEHGMTPSFFSELPRKEKALIMAFTDIKIEAEQKERKYSKK